MIVDKARRLPYSRPSEWFFNKVGPCFTNKHWAKLERLARSKHSGLLRNFVTDGRKKFYDIGPPDRYVEQEGDEDGVIRGTYTYLDPNWTWQTVGSSSTGLDFGIVVNYSRLSVCL